MAGYGDDDGLTAWLGANGYSLPVGAPSAAVLRQRGSTYIDGAYGDRFSGSPTGGASQEREWPRTGASDRYGNALAPDAVPVRVVEASYYAAYLEAKKPGLLSLTYTPGTQKVLTEVKGIKWTVVGDASSDGSMVPVSTAIEGILAPLLSPADLPAVLVV
jgi:hypothetical protein